MSRSSRRLLLIVVGALVLGAPLNATAQSSRKAAAKACKSQRKSLGNHKFVARHLGASAARTRTKTRRNISRALKRCVAKKTKKTQGATPQAASTTQTNATSSAETTNQPSSEIPTASADAASAASTSSDASATADPEQPVVLQALIAPRTFASPTVHAEEESGISSTIPITSVRPEAVVVSPSYESYETHETEPRIRITPASPAHP